MIDKYEGELLKIINRLLDIIKEQKEFYRQYIPYTPYWHYSYTTGDTAPLCPTVTTGCPTVINGSVCNDEQ